MEADLLENVAFHLTGRRTGETLAAAEGRGLRPALLARYRDLSALRHDFPLVFLPPGAPAGPVVSLSVFVDGLVPETAPGAEADRVRAHALRLERALRAAPAGRLSELWAEAERTLGSDAAFTASAQKLRTALAPLAADGEVVGCDRDLPARLLTHLWRDVQARKSERMRQSIDRLALGLADILRADDAASAAGLRPERLRTQFGTSFAGDFDFNSLSRLLTESKPVAAIPAPRRRRIEGALRALQGQAFFPTLTQESSAGVVSGFLFDSCAAALEAWRSRLPQVVELSKAMAVALLEIEGRYRDAVHDPMFEALGANELGPVELARFPDYLVCVRADALTADDDATIAEVLEADLPMKVLLQTDDLAAPIRTDQSKTFPGVLARQLTHAAMGLGTAYVLQSASSHLYRARPRLLRGLEFAGAALFNVYSGAGGETGGLPPYLVAAAAMESRAFPAFSYDPSAGDDWSARFTVDGNPQPGRDWPLHEFTWEDEALQRCSESVEFTAADFLALDARHARHLAVLPKERWNGRLTTLSEFAATSLDGLPTTVPHLLMVDGENRLQRVIADSKLVREARRCRERWRSLQELGGIRDQRADRRVAEARREWDEQTRLAAEADGQAAKPVAPQAVAPAAPPVATTSAEPAAKRSPGEPYIETARCSTCNECTRLNDRMFKYNANKQAYIADLNAGTYAQMVQAAEACQVAIIHPGKPVNPNEPGLDSLLERAAAFP